MMTNTRKIDVYIGCDHPGYLGTPRAGIVVGHAFGPALVALHCHVEEALHEFDERFGKRIDWEADKATLADYDGETIEEQAESAMNCGDVRVNDGGTTVWVDHYEWIREFDSKAELREFLRAHGIPKR